MPWVKYDNSKCWYYIFKKNTFQSNHLVSARLRYFIFAFEHFDKIEVKHSNMGSIVIDMKHKYTGPCTNHDPLTTTRVKKIEKE